MASQQNSVSFPLGPVVFVLFLALKLTGVIAWSWWWVTAPLWGPWAIMIVLGLLALPFAIRKAQQAKKNKPKDIATVLEEYLKSTQKKA